LLMDENGEVVAGLRYFDQGGGSVWIRPDLRRTGLLEEIIDQLKGTSEKMVVRMLHAWTRDPSTTAQGGAALQRLIKRELDDMSPRAADDLGPVRAQADEAVAAAEPTAIPAYRAVREWDNIPDDQLIEVYHATSVETAEKMVREGIRVAEKPQGVFDPDKVDPGLFVGDSPERVRRYGRLAGGGGTDSPHVILAVTVRKGDLEVPITETAGALQPPTVPQVLTRPNVGATIKKDLPPSAFRILDEDAI